MTAFPDSASIHLHSSGPRKTPGASAFYDPARALPADPEQERCVLSCMMQAPEHAVPVAAQMLQPEQFSVEAHGLLYDLLLRRHIAGEPVDPVSITSVLYERGLMEKMGGPGLVAEVYPAAPDPAHTAHYAKHVIATAKRRELIKISSGLMGAAFDGSIDGDWRDTASRLVRDAEVTLADSRPSQVKTIRQIAEEYLHYIDGGDASAIDPPVPTGIRGLDDILCGGIRREFIGIGSLTGHGKTLLAMQMAGQLCRAGRGVLVVGYEMSALQLLMRDLAREARVPLNEVMGRTPFSQGSPRMISRLLSEWMESRRLFIIDDPQVSLETVAAQARYLHRQGNLDAIVVDYLQLAPVKRARDERRDEVLTELANACERLRKELNCTLIAPVQINEDGTIRESRGILFPMQCYMRIEMDRDADDDPRRSLDTGILRVIKQRAGEWNRTCPILREGALQTFTDA